MTSWLQDRVRLIGLVVTALGLMGLISYVTMPRQEDPGFPYPIFVSRI
jgi:multidrug efflux pump subunit AcrB